MAVLTFLYSRKTTIGLGITAVILAMLLVFGFPQKSNCYSVFALTYVPPPYNFSEVKFNKAAEGKTNCSTEAVRFINGDQFDWSLEEREEKAGLKTYRFDLTHMNFTEENGRRYTFVSDRNGNPALLGFIDNTLIYITNTKEPKLLQEDMLRMFNGLQKK